MLNDDKYKFIERVPQNNALLIKYVLEHSFVLQSLSSDGSPTQAFPSPAGAGLEHVRIRRCTPEPHDLLHSSHVVHSAQLPSTRKFFFTFNILGFMIFCQE